MDFIRFCYQCASLGRLNLNNEGLICLYEECLVMALHFQDPPMQPMIYFQLGSLNKKIYRYTDAIKYLKKLLDITGSSELRMCVLQMLGENYYYLGEFHKSIECCQMSLNIATEIVDKNCKETSKKLLDIMRLSELRMGLLLMLGENYYCLGEFQKSIECSQMSLNIATEIHKNYKVAANHQSGKAYASLGKNYKAIEYFNNSLYVAVQIGDRFSEVEAHEALGHTYEILGKNQEAMKHYLKQLEISIEIGYKTGEGRGYSGLGLIHGNLGKNHEAIDYHKKHLKIALEMGDKENEGIAYCRLGLANADLSNYDQAVVFFEKDLAISKTTGNKDAEGSAYSSLGTTYQSLAKHHKAIEYLKKALNIFLETGNKSGQSTAYSNLGNASSSLGKFHDSITYHKKALDIAIEIGERGGEGVSNGNLGSVYQVLHRYDEALPYLQKRLEIAIEMDDKYGEEHACGNLGILYYLKYNSQESVKYHEKELRLAVEIGDKKGEGEAYLHLGTVFFSEGYYPKAINYYEKSLKTAVEISDKNGEGECYHKLGFAYSLSGNYDMAIENYQKSLNIAKDNGNKRVEGTAFSGLGEIHLKLSQDYKNREDTQDQEKYFECTKKSEMYLRDAVGCWEWMFENLQSQNRYKISIFREFIETYKLLTAVLIETQQFEEALLVSERGRSRVLDDTLVSKYDMSSQENASANNLSFKNIAEVQEFSKSCKVCVLFYAIESAGLLNWVLDHDKPMFCHRNEISKNQSWMFQEKVINQVITHAYEQMNVRQGIICEDRSLGRPQEGEPLVNPYAEGETDMEYSPHFLGNFEKMNLSIYKTDFTVRSGSEKATQQEMLHENVEQAIQQLVLQKVEEKLCDKHPLELLFDILVGPLLESNRLQEEVVIIPEGPLYRVPFSALRDPRTGHYLSETNRIRLAPSLTALTILKESPADFHSKKGALIVGNPEVGEVMFKGERETMKPLPSAEHEAKIISQIFGIKPVTKSEATKGFVKHRLKEGVALIHIAAHGGNGEIVLAPTKGNKGVPEEQDYLLTMKEIQEIGVSAQLVVLSCCHSGEGSIWPEGVVSMSRAFLAAGARSVVASLWAIDDDATLSFMVSFYTHLKMGESASKSLQQAMKELREEGYDKPKYWAPFFLIGDDVIINI